jgi:heme/copper-type cytochrome/quinol oxidase subunit 2
MSARDRSRPLSVAVMGTALAASGIVLTATETIWSTIATSQDVNVSAAVVPSASAIAGPNANAISSVPLPNSSLPNPLVVTWCGTKMTWEICYNDSDHLGDHSIIRHPDRLLTLPADHPVTLRFESRDYVYTWAAPALSAQQIAVPQLHFEITLPPLPPGPVEFVGNQFCGGDHTRLSGVIHVVTKDEFVQRWQQRSADVTTREN